MWKFRLSLGLALFGLAGLCVLLAWHWDALGIGLFGALVLWFGAASFAWKGVRALLSRLPPPRGQAVAGAAPPAAPGAGPGSPAPPSWPGQPYPGPERDPRTGPGGGEHDAGVAGTPDAIGPSATPVPPGTPGTGSGELGQAVWGATRDTLTGMRRTWVVLALVLLVPMTLGLTVWGLITLGGGDLPTGGTMLAVAGFLAWYCCRPLRRFW